jgi:cell division septal protein FtsQ
MYEQNYHKTVLKTETQQTKKRRVRINWKLVAGIVSIVIVVVGIVLIIRLPKVQVRTITVVGANVVDPGDVSQFVTSTLQGYKLGVLPRSSIFLVQEHVLEQQIKNAFPRLQTVKVSRKNFSTLTVTVTEFQGIYLWCSDPMTCDFMDQNGVVFSPAPYFSGSAYPKIFVAGQHAPLPFQALDANQLSIVQLLNEHLPMINIAPQEFHFVTGHELDVDFNHNGQQAQLLFDPTLDANQSLEALYAGLRTDPLATEFHDSTKMLEYIDLRFMDRVVYKFQ